MRLATVRTADGTRAARVEGDRLLLLAAPDVGALLAGGQGAEAAADGETFGELAFADASFAPLVPHPEKIFCVGLNYRSHIREMGDEIPSYPTLFAKFASSLIGAEDDLVLPSVSDAVDWEVELGVVIGRRTRRVGHRRGTRGDRRIHGRERRLDARLAEKDDAVPAGQDVRRVHSGRSGTRDTKRSR